MIWGLKQPVFSAAALEIWVLSRVWYTVGYIGYGPKGVRIPHHRGRILPHLFFFFVQRVAAGRLTAVALIGKSFCFSYSRWIQMC